MRINISFERRERFQIRVNSNAILPDIIAYNISRDYDRIYELGRSMIADFYPRNTIFSVEFMCSSCGTRWSMETREDPSHHMQCTCGTYLQMDRRMWVNSQNNW